MAEFHGALVYKPDECGFESYLGHGGAFLDIFVQIYILKVHFEKIFGFEPDCLQTQGPYSTSRSITPRICTRLIFEYIVLKKSENVFS